jgi:hypothetical protein
MLVGELEELGPDCDRLFVPPQRRESERLGPSPAQQRLGAVDVARQRTCLPGELGRALVLADPVRALGVKVQVVGAVIPPEARNPQLQGAVPELERTIEITFGTAHGKALALHRERGGDT